MNIRLICTLILFQAAFSKNVFSQITFQKTFGDSLSQEALAGTITLDGGYFLAGDAYGLPTDNDFYLVKTDANGNLLWGKTYGTPGWEYLNAAIATTDGGFLLAGSTDTTNNTNADACLVKTDANGNLEWAKKYAGINYDVAYSVAEIPSGFIVGGMTRNQGAGSDEMLLFQTDSAGNLIWAKTYGGVSVESAQCVHRTHDGGYALAGESLGFGSGMYDAYFVKTDAAGNLQWSKTYGGSANYEYLTSFYQTEDDGYMLCGATGSFGSGQYESYMVRTDSAGDVLYSKTYGTVANENFNSVAPVSDGGYILTQRSYNFTTSEWNGTLIRTDANGDSLWTRTYGGSNINQCWDAVQTNDGGFVVSGFTRSFGAGDEDFYLLKTDTNGESGCNQKYFPIDVSSPVSMVTTPATQVFVPVLTASPVATIVASLGYETPVCFETAAGEAGLPELIIGPNPLPHGQELMMNTKANPAPLSVELINVLGTVQLSTVMHSGQAQRLNTKDFSPGMYLLNITDGSKSFSRKIIIE